MTSNAHGGGAIYRIIFAVLCVCTGLSWLADEARSVLDVGFLLPVIVLSIAVVKAACVLLIFMHVRFERAWKYLLLVPTAILSVGLPMALIPDVGVHYYHMDVPQDPISDGAFLDIESDTH